MKKEIAKKWVKALRSGKYKQGKGFLKQLNKDGEPRHCCLGVLCELYNDIMKKSHKKKLHIQEMEDYSTGTSFIRFDLVDGGLPKKVKKWADITNSLGEFTINNGEYDIEECLADLNDSGKKFSTIANIIEKNVESL